MLTKWPLLLFIVKYECLVVCKDLERSGPYILFDNSSPEMAGMNQRGSGRRTGGEFLDNRIIG